MNSELTVPELPSFDENRHLLQGSAVVREFCLAGKAIITLYSHKTTRHYTYKIRKNKTLEVWWVYRLGPDNTWIFLGGLFDRAMRFGPTRDVDRRDRQSIQYEVFDWFWNELQYRDKVHHKLSVFHEGRCGACGKPLTDPISITAGFGPTCRENRFTNLPVNDKV